MNWWQYLVLVNLYLLLFYSFYVLLLRKETFFQLNRIYLVTTSLISFIIPLIQSDWVKDMFITKQVQLTIYSSPVIFYNYQPVKEVSFTIGQAAVIFYLAGILLLTVRFAMQLSALKKIIDQPRGSAPYSFFKTIKVHEDHNRLIIAHEEVHANQWHSADVLWMEVVMIINWFNPVVYFYRSTIRHIHEYIADRQIVKAGTDKADYALLLLGQTFNVPAHQLVNPFFNHSLLKQRIMMLQKNKSQRIALAKYCLSAPLFILMLILSSAMVNNSKTMRYFNKKAGQVFSRPATLTPIQLDKTANQLEEAKSHQIVAVVSSNDTGRITPPVFTSVEQVPEFPGGINAFGAYLGKNIHYPAEARKNGMQGRVIISLVVEKDGSLTNVKVVRGVTTDIDEEAVRVIKTSPKWKPGVQNGKIVRVAYSVPISFTLDDNKKSNSTGNVIENKELKTITLASGDMIVTKPDSGETAANTYVFDKSKKPLLILDGKEISDISKVDASKIENMSILKDNQATDLYGAKAKYGAIIIKSKPVMLMLLPPAKGEKQ